MDNNISEIQRRFGIVGEDSVLLQSLDTAVQVASTQLSVLVLGESGSGKDVFPQIIHAYSVRKHGPYVPVNCGAIPEGTIDSELFGHEKGAFTGATNERKGYFEEANGGTIFLDEIGELPISTQAKLLRVLESGEYMRVGSSTVRRTDVRIVAATNLNLEKAVANKKFREDLYYRLSGVVLRIPPLRFRRGDIPQLFRNFVTKFVAENRVPPIRLTDEAFELLKSYDWPGNIRQLKNVAEKVTILSPERQINAEILSSYMPGQNSVYPPIIYGDEVGEHSYHSEREILYKILFDMRNDVSDLRTLLGELIEKGSISPDNAPLVKRLYGNGRPVTGKINGIADVHAEDVTVVPYYNTKTTMADHVNSILDGNMDEYPPYVVDDNLSLAENERRLISRVLAKCKGHRKTAAKQLGISERTLFRKIVEYQIEGQ